MQNGDFGRLGPRLDLPGKKIGGGPKAQGVSKSGEFNTLGCIAANRLVEAFSLTSEES